MSEVNVFVHEDYTAVWFSADTRGADGLCIGYGDTQVEALTEAEADLLTALDAVRAELAEAGVITEDRMPHDKNGTLLQVGDEVLIRATVEQIFSDANAQFRTTAKPTPDFAKGDLLTLNCNQVEKVTTSASAPV